MTAVDADKAVIFDGTATAGAWGPVLRGCAASPAQAAEEPDELRVRVHRHLKRHPMLTAYEIARALRLPGPAGGGSTRVRYQLVRMEIDGEARRHTGPRTDGDRRPAVRWEAT